jgi:uncharacterized protein (DUF1778 family)
MGAATSDSTSITLDLHPSIFECLQQAADLSGLSVRDFCVLAIHFESGRVIDAHNALTRRRHDT